MADNPISKSDIIDGDGINKMLKEIIATIEKLSAVAQSTEGVLSSQAKTLMDSLQGVNLTKKEDIELTKQVAQQADLLNAEYKQLLKINKDRIAAEGKLKSLYSDEALQLAKIKQEHRARQKELERDAKLQTVAKDSVVAMRIELQRLTEQYNKLDKAARKEAAPAINKMTEELKKAEGAIGNNTRSVGSYTRSIIDAGKQLIGFTGVVGLVIGAFNQLKNSFANTETGFVKMKQIGAIWKQFWYDLVENQKVSFKNLILASSAAQQTAKEELTDRLDLVQIAELEGKIALKRYESEKATGSERLKLLEEAIALEDQLIAFKEKELQIDLKNVQGELAQRRSIDLLQKESEILAELARLQGDRNLRLLTRSESARKQAEADAKKEAEQVKILMQGAEMAGMKKIDITAKAAIQTGYIRDNELRQNKEIAEEQKRQIKAVSDYEIQERQKTETEKEAITQEYLTQASTSLTVFGDLFESAKQRELSAVGDNAKAREEIERKYAKRQQVLSIGQALVNGAMAITEIQKKWAANPVMMGILTALESARTIAQVAVIKGQKFAKGGSGILEGAVHASGGVPIMGVGEAEGGEHFSITSRAMTSKYGGRMLDAVSSSINQGKFFEVWANANKGMGVTADPYTKKMYELMTKTPTVYTDSTGATVKEYADGRKIIIKKMQFFKN